jgi:hypothetical protein
MTDLYIVANLLFSFFGIVVLYYVCKKLHDNCRMPKVYIAGPMTGYENHNFATFDYYQKVLYIQGYTVVNPANIARKIAKKYKIDLNDAEQCKKYYNVFMKADLKALLKCENVFFLNGWEVSNGASIEKIVADAAGLKCMYENKVVFDEK